MIPDLNGQIWSLYEPGVKRSSVAWASSSTNSSVVSADQLGAPGPRRWHRNGAVAIIPVQGIIYPQSIPFLEMLGVITTPATVAGAVRDALGESDVEAIVLDVDSPGGVVSAVPETAARLEALRASATVPIVAMSRYLMASAAYWLAAAAAHQIVVSPSSLTGSIGVLTEHVDASRLYETIGLDISIIHAGQYKAELSDTMPLSDEARAHLQSHVDYYYEEFVGAVARSRRKSPAAVRDGMADGRVQVAREAVSMGMADRAEDMDALMARLAMPRQRRAILRAETDQAEADEIYDQLERQLDEAAANGPPPDDDTEEVKETAADAVAAVLEERYGSGH